MAFKSFTLDSSCKQIRQYGDLRYEYNPLRVFRTSEDLYDEDGSISSPKNSIIDLDTTLLTFDINHPVDIKTLVSYDGSVNLILNDGNHEPRMINTRFTPTGMDTYKIVDREGDNDSNIYDDTTFSSDISLYKKIHSLPKLLFNGVYTGGNLKCGTYVFYFKLADADGNETDIVAESSTVACYIGSLNKPTSIQGGLEDRNSYKNVMFTLTNIDATYDRVHVYYTRSTSGPETIEATTAFKIDKEFTVRNLKAQIYITGFESVEEISIVDVNTEYTMVDSAKTEETCQNMLFLGNVQRPEIPFAELTDLSLRICPQLKLATESIGNLNQEYVDPTGKYMYYNVYNIYNKVGYWNDEIYRFGIVYIMNDFSLTPVFNVRGTLTPLTTAGVEYTDYKDLASIEVDTATCSLGNDENSKGVVRIFDTALAEDKSQLNGYPLYILMVMQSIGEGKKTYLPNGGTLKEALQALGIRGYFFVRLKRIPTTLCQAALVAIEKTSRLPVLPIGKSTWLAERVLDSNRILTHEFNRRILNLEDIDVTKGYAAICPEYDIQPAYFNQIFTGTEFTMYSSVSNFGSTSFNRSMNHCYMGSYKTKSSRDTILNYVVAVPDGQPGIKCHDEVFKSMSGEAEDLERINYYQFKSRTNDAYNWTRGCWGPYLGVEGHSVSDLQLVDIKIPGYSENNISKYFQIRFEDASSFYAISDRHDISEMGETSEELYRGDCFICQFTHRMNRNFQDPVAPTNDIILEESTWKDHYEYNGADNSKINRSDVNAVKMGHWVTFRVCSSFNLSLRSADNTYPLEQAMTGMERTFFPLSARSTEGAYKIPEALCMNAAYGSTTSDKYYFERPNVPAIKNVFNTRIMYSDIAITDAFKNGYRVFRNVHYLDYPATYGSIMKLVELQGSIIVVYEHGVALIPVNERAVAAEAAGGEVYINSSNVLPQNPKVLNGTFGTLWPDSVIKTDYFVYGVDTVGKKIWRTNGVDFELISDFKVQKFLNDNISLQETEKTPIIGVRNVKSHYNAFKHDVMFTFYDDINTLEENVWNLCYNELTAVFTTMYSWIPSYSCNIDNIFFSFDRTTSKLIAKAWANENTEESEEVNGVQYLFIKDNYYTDKSVLGKVKYGGTDSNVTATIEIRNNVVTRRYTLIPPGDNDDGWYTISTEGEDLSYNGIKYHTIPILITLSGKSESYTGSEVDVGKIIYASVVCINSSTIDQLTTAFWKHGLAGLMDTNDQLKPCMWYGRQHPFEFEFIVSEAIYQLKIFDTLKIISNNVAPESIHYEIVGDGYEFANEKSNLFFRLEALKHLYLYNGGDILYDDNYLNITPKLRDIYMSLTGVKDKSTIFPIYYGRIDSIEDIADHYESLLETNKHYESMTGSEVIYDDQLDEYRIDIHQKICPLDGYYWLEVDKLTWDLYNTGSTLWAKVENGKYYLLQLYGRVQGNAQYQEDLWNVQIPSLHYCQKNEDPWINGKCPPLTLVNSPLPESMNGLTLSSDDNIPEDLKNLGYTINNPMSFDLTKWDNDLETRPRDKYIKIRIRYTGNKLALIHSLITQYTLSYT